MTQTAKPTMGYAYFNTSNKQWEWTKEKPQACEGARKLRSMSLEDFKHKYGGCHD